MSRVLLTLAALLTLSATASAQLWTDVATSRVAPRADIEEYRVVVLDEDAFARALAGPGTIAMPMPEGGFAEVQVTSSSIMAPALQARYPQIQTFEARANGATGRLSWTEHGLKGLLFDATGTVVIDPLVHGERGVYAVYRMSSMVVPEAFTESLIGDDLMIPGDAQSPQARQARAIGETLRTYRFAASARGEYVAANGGTVASGLAAVVAAVNRVNALFERDLAVRFELVANNDEIIYTDATSDPFTARGSANLSVNQTVLDREIGSANYDIGHLIGFNESGGVAYLRSVCSTFKAGGVSGVSSETSAFDLLVLPHEIGHQLGAPHAFSVVVGQDGPSFEPNGVEPFMGYTIMSYGHFAGGGANPFRPSAERIGFFFHGESIRFMNQHVRSGGGTCGTDTATGNVPPVVTVDAAAITVPSQTPFTLDGRVTDESGTDLTYTWEQVDSYGDGSGSIPLFRSLPLSDQTTRTFPDLDRALSGNPYPDETLPARSGTYTFQLVARDNVVGAGAIGTGRTVVTVDGSQGPFAVTSQQFPLVYEEGSDIDVTWSVAGTDAAPYGVATVEIRYTPDGGASWTVLAAATPNDGAETFALPSGAVTDGRILIQPAGQVFFALSQVSFTTGARPVATLSDAEIDQSLVPEGTETRRIQIGNTGPAGSTLRYQVSIENVASPGGGLIDTLSDYQSSDSDDEGGPAVGFTDISGTGTAVLFSDADDGAATIQLPFSFPFYSDAYTSLSASTNGYLALESTLVRDFTNQSIPSADDPNGLIAPMWDDLVMGSGGAHTATLDDGLFAIQYTNVNRYQGQGDSDPGTFTFQVILSPDGTIEYQYGTMLGETASATVGIESPSGEEGTQLAFNEDYVTSNKAVRFSIERSWIGISNDEGTIAPGASASVPVALDAKGLTDAVLTADLVIRTSDPEAARTVIPVTLTVRQEPVATEGGPVEAEVSLVAPNPAGSYASVRLTLTEPQVIRASVVDALGREVAVLHDGMATGTLDLDVEAGQLATGVYVIRVVGGDWVESRQMVVAR